MTSKPDLYILCTENIFIALHNRDSRLSICDRAAAALDSEHSAEFPEWRSDVERILAENRRAVDEYNILIEKLETLRDNLDKANYD